MRKLSIKKEIPLCSILFATTSNPNYEMNRTFILDNYNLPKEIEEQIDYNKDGYNYVIVVEGYHCSCYDFDDTDWDAMIYTREEFLKLCEGSYKEENIWQLAKNYFEN